MNDELGDRMKAVEARETNRRFPDDSYLYARLDGRAFTTVTKDCYRPFDQSFMTAMHKTAEHLVTQSHAVVAYVQSDEISLLWSPIAAPQQRLFNGSVHKLTSVLAGIASSVFTTQFSTPGRTIHPHFDARVVAVTDVEAVEMFRWRSIDAERNAITSIARSIVDSSKELHGLSSQAMIKTIIGEREYYDDEVYGGHEKYGAFLRRRTVRRLLTELERDQIPEAFRPDPDQLITRTAVELDAPICLHALPDPLAFLLTGAR